MTVGSGIGASMGIGNEGASYGSYTTPTRWLEFESESVLWNPSRTEGKGIYNGGLAPRATQRATTSATVAGDIVTPVYTKGMGLWLGLIAGTLGLTPAQLSGTTAYYQAHTIGGNGNQSASLQIGRPTMDGTQHQYNYLGVKVTKAVFEAKVNEPLRLTLSVDAKDYQESSAYTSPTYLTANPPLFWHQGTFEMGAFGSEVAVEGVRDFKFTIERPQRVDNFYLDGTGRKGAPVQNGFLKMTVELTTDFLSKTAFADLFTADTAQSIIVPFVGANIASTFNYQCKFSLPRVHFNNDHPVVSGPDILQPKMIGDCLYDDTNGLPVIGYTSTDTTL